MKSTSTAIYVSSEDEDSFRRTLSGLPTPNALERVVNWMGINDESSMLIDEPVNTNSTCAFFRCDYKSSKTAGENINETLILDKGIPLLDSIDNKHTYASPQDDNAVNMYVCDKKLRKKSIRTNASCVDSKKKELCSYLKLMTRNGKKKIFHSRYRRSRRVRNLEQKKLVVAKSYNEDIQSEKSTKTIRSRFSDGINAFALQSFEDLNMLVDTSKYPLLQESIENKIFNFVMPPDTVLQEFNDFKYWIESFVGIQNANGKLNSSRESCDTSKLGDDQNRDKARYKMEIVGTKNNSCEENVRTLRKRIKSEDILICTDKKIVDYDKIKNYDKKIRESKKTNDCISLSHGSAMNISELVENRREDKTKCKSDIDKIKNIKCEENTRNSSERAIDDDISSYKDKLMKNNDRIGNDCKKFKKKNTNSDSLFKQNNGNKFITLLHDETKMNTDKLEENLNNDHARFQMEMTEIKSIKSDTNVEKLKTKTANISSEKNERLENNDRIKNDYKKIEEKNTNLNSLLKQKNENKCIILLHDEIVKNCLNEDNILPNIEPNDFDHTDTDCERIKIRIDYNNEDKHNDCKREITETELPYFKGFSKRQIDECGKIVYKLNFCMNCILDVPEIKNDFKRFIGKNNGSCIIKDNCRNLETDAHSKDSENSDSLDSDIPSDDSSSSSSFISDSLSVKKISTPNCETVKLSEIPRRVGEVTPFSESSKVQPLHDLLKKQIRKVPSSVALNYVQEWDSDNSMNGKLKFSPNKNTSHFISFTKMNGTIQNAIYDDFNLILVQEFAVSMWNQTALGNVLGAQNLWIFNGETKRLILNKECIRKKSLEMTVTMENCVTYVELWTKEHKSDIRQGPVADIFVIVYFWLQKSNRIDKKVHQLENIKGFSDDVQYVVLKSSLEIVVSWHSVAANVKVTQVRVYTLASDFQTIINVRALSKVEHYVSSLHNIEDCEDLLMGCGEHSITLWNIEHGYIVASIKLNDIKLCLSTLWTKCDRGILFTVQQCVDKELRLIAINGRSHSWKKLKSYKPPEGFERIQNVYIENGVLISFYEEGIVCWKAQTEEQILEETHEADVKYFPSGKYVVMSREKTVFIRHALTHLLTSD